MIIKIKLQNKLLKIRPNKKDEDYKIEFIRDRSIPGVKVKISATENSTNFKGETEFIAIQAKIKLYVKHQKD